MPKGIGYYGKKAAKNFGKAMTKREKATVHGKRARDLLLAMGGVAVKRKAKRTGKNVAGALKRGLKGGGLVGKSLKYRLNKMEKANKPKRKRVGKKNSRYYSKSGGFGRL